MTEKKMVTLVEKWRKRLAPEWRLTEVKAGFPEDTEDDGQRASVWRSDDYLTARLYVSEKHLADGDDADIEQTIVHEILHLLTRSLMDAANRPLLSLGDETSRIARQTNDHFEEQLVDRLAFSFVDMERGSA